MNERIWPVSSACSAAASRSFTRRSFACGPAHSVIGVLVRSQAHRDTAGGPAGTGAAIGARDASDGCGGTRGWGGFPLEAAQDGGVASDGQAAITGLGR